MAQPKDILLGPFSKGLRTDVQAHLLAPDEATDNLDVDYSSGALRGLPGPGAALAATVTAGATFLAWVGKNAWASSLFGDSSLNDANKADGTGISYRTQKTSATAASYPLRIAGATSTRLGIVAPASAPSVATSSGGSGTNKDYVYTFITADGLESNPSTRAGFSASSSDNLTVTMGSSSDPQVTGVRLYSTLQGQRSGTLYYRGDFAEGAVLVDTTSDGSTDTTRPINWGVGGSASSSSLPYDHSPAPDLTILSDNVHAVNEGSGAPGSGIVFGAKAHVLYWSMLGYGAYWPTVNQFPMNETIQAIVTAKTRTLVFTDSTVLAFSGYSDAALSSETVSHQGILNGCGKTAIDTPWGVVWLSREGLVLWAGGEPQVISRMLRTKDLTAGGYTHAAYFDHRYYLFGATDTLVFDLRAFPAIQVTRSSVIATASHVTPYDPTGATQGLFIATPAGAIQPWRITDETTDRLPWSHTSGKLTAGEPNRLKHFTRAFPQGEGAVTLAFYRDDEATPVLTHAMADAAAADPFWLPAGVGKSLTVEASSPDGTGRLDELRIETEVLNG